MPKALKFGPRFVEPDVRRLSDLKDVIFDKIWLRSTKDRNLYFMYRDLWLTEDDRKLIESYNLRYDITVIPNGHIGREYVKTLGHYHPFIPGSRISYPELYQVLEGKAHYLMQKSGDEKIVDVVVVEAKKDDIVIIPPNYGHVTVNPSNSELKMANWTSRNFKSEYSDIIKKGGATYFELTDNKFEKNTNYNNLPKIRFLEPLTASEIGLVNSRDIYDLVKDISKLRWLNEPRGYEWLFRKTLTREKKR